MKTINLKLFQEFLTSESLSGIILIACVILSLTIANSPLSEYFDNFLAFEIGFNSGYLQLKYPFLSWVNDGLMAIFFLMVGLEIKRELLEGELASIKKAALPVFAALGGVIAPALIYFFFNHSTNSAQGWGIPMATDIAFALAIITLLGDKVPLSLKIFLAALAIVDDLVAIVVIAIFYSSDLHVLYLTYTVGIFLLLMGLNRFGVKSILFYLVPGLAMWYFIHHSGIHATIAGVLTAFTLPTTPDKVESPLEKLEHALMKPVNFLIMPLFALTNTNIQFKSGMLEALATPLGFGITLGLLIGKPLGIFLFCYSSVKAGLCSLPTGAQWSHIFGVGILGGIGFTMSIFIANLSFGTHPLILSEAKFAILTGSILAGLLGYIVLKRISKKS